MLESPIPHPVHLADPRAAARRASCAYGRRALALWPGLDRRALARCHCDPWRIAGIVARRTIMSREAIYALLRMSDLDEELYFG